MLQIKIQFPIATMKNKCYKVNVTFVGKVFKK